MKHLNLISIILFLILTVLNFESRANVLGNMQTFAPNPDSLIFQNIHSSLTMEKNYFNVGFFTAYVRNELSVYDNLANPQFVEYKDKAYTFDFILGWGITKNLEFTYSLPGYFKQEPDSGQTQNYYISEGINGHRLGFKYNISQTYGGGFAVATSVDLTSSIDNPYIGNSPSPIWNGELIYDKRNHHSAFGFNLGYRKRSPGTAAVDAYYLPISDQLIASAGYVVGLDQRWRFHSELFSSYGLKKDNHPSQTYINSLEILLGGKYRFLKNLWGHAGLTAEIVPKGLAPDYRIYLGMNYFFNFKSSNSDENKANHNSTLSVFPKEMYLTKNESKDILVTGGSAPYTFELKNKLGTFDQTQLLYTASDELGDDEILVRDSDGATITVPVYIRESNRQKFTDDSFQILTSEINVYVGGVILLKKTGGQEPFSAELNPSGFGRFSTESFKYRAPMTPGDVELTVQDSQQQARRILIHVLAVPKSQKTVTLKNLNFVFNTSHLTKSSLKELQKNIANMEKVLIKKIIVIGHTDNIGSDDYNQDLSQKRAEAVAKILRTKFSLDEDQVEAIGYGESSPIASNNNEKGRLTNRRVELKLYYNK